MAETIMILKGDATHMIKEVSVYMLYRDGKKSKLLGERKKAISSQIHVLDVAAACRCALRNALPRMRLLIG